jgi:hypothetical protein
MDGNVGVERLGNETTNIAVTGGLGQGAVGGQKQEPTMYKNFRAGSGITKLMKNEK